MTESSSYQERHARAATTFAVFVPGVDPERVAVSDPPAGRPGRLRVSTWSARCGPGPSCPGATGR